jgi:hypothetical protein
VEGRGRGIRLGIVSVNRQQEEPAGSDGKAAAFNGWYEPCESRFKQGSVSGSGCRLGTEAQSQYGHCAQYCAHPVHGMVITRCYAQEPEPDVFSILNMPVTSNNKA